MTWRARNVPLRILKKCSYFLEQFEIQDGRPGLWVGWTFFIYQKTKTTSRLCRNVPMRNLNLYSRPTPFMLKINYLCVSPIMKTSRQRNDHVGWDRNPFILISLSHLGRCSCWTKKGNSNLYLNIYWRKYSLCLWLLIDDRITWNKIYIYKTFILFRLYVN